MSNLLVQNIKHTNNTTAIEINSSAQMSVKSDGGASTTNLQQGLAKTWISYSNATSTTATNDSFNVSSVGDNGTGNQTHNHTNAFRANKAYTVGGAAANANDVTVTSYQIQPLQDDTVLTTSIQIVNIYNTDTACNVSDYAYLSLSCHGDLA